MSDLTQDKDNNIDTDAAEHDDIIDPPPVLSYSLDKNREEISASHKRFLEEKIISISTYEKRRIGRDLHDGLSAHFSGLSMLIQRIVNRRKKEHDISVESLEEILRLCQRGIYKIKSFAHGLNPTYMGLHDLEVALRDLTEQTEHIAEVACKFEYRITSAFELEEEVAAQIYWIAREAINNAVKHAHASQIEVSLNIKPDRFFLTISDDGIGFTPDPERKGMGLQTMEYRANSIGAALDINTDPHRGTIVTCYSRDKDKNLRSVR